MPDARCTRGLACNSAQRKAHTSIQVQRRAIRHSLRNGFTAYIALTPGYRAFLPPSPADSWLIRARSGRLAFRRLDTNH